MADGFRVDVKALTEAADGVVGTMQAVGEKRVSDIDRAKSSFGHDHLAGTVSDFCDRWQIGVEHLIKDTQEVADRLVRSADVYLKIDRTGQHRMEQILQGSGPDPAAQ
ncbi:MAG: hypothetical protein ABJA34_00390 [Pseudonocardiales bacterium]